MVLLFGVKGFTFACGRSVSIDVFTDVFGADVESDLLPKRGGLVLTDVPVFPVRLLAFSSKLFGVCGVSNKRNARNFL
jgi:hypothetical protein